MVSEEVVVAAIVDALGPSQDAPQDCEINIGDSDNPHSECNELVESQTISRPSTAENDIDPRFNLIEQMADQIGELLQIVRLQTGQSAPKQQDIQAVDPSNEQFDQLRAEVDELASHLRDVENDNDELRQQNNDLAARLASENVRSTVSSAQSSTSDALTWEERKALILKQMEQDSFDAEVFVAELQSEFENEEETPADFVHALLNRLNRADAELVKRDAEIGELRMLLQQQSATRHHGVAIGAAAIAELIDADELIIEERGRLQLMQAEWEDKFRRSEIDASLERAKLSRERQQLADKTAKLEEQMEHLRREARQTEEVGSASSRRWMVKLGLAGS